MLIRFIDIKKTFHVTHKIEVVLLSDLAHFSIKMIVCSLRWELTVKLKCFLYLLKFYSELQPR